MTNLSVIRGAETRASKVEALSVAKLRAILGKRCTNPTLQARRIGA